MQHTYRIAGTCSSLTTKTAAGLDSMLAHRLRRCANIEPTLKNNRDRTIILKKGEGSIKKKLRVN